MDHARTHDDSKYEAIEAIINKGDGGLGMEMELFPPFGGLAAEKDSRNLAMVLISGFVNDPDGSPGAAAACGMLRKGDIVAAIDGTSIPRGTSIGEVARRSDT